MCRAALAGGFRISFDLTSFKEAVGEPPAGAGGGIGPAESYVVGSPNARRCDEQGSKEERSLPGRMPATGFQTISGEQPFAPRNLGAVALAAKRL